MATFDSLPRELILAILDYMGRRDISRLSCTSKHFRAAVEPSLYREIRVDCRKIKVDHNHIGGNDTEARPRVHLLLRTILSRPWLAQQIESLEFPNGSLHSRQWTKVPTGPSCNTWIWEDLLDVTCIRGFTRAEMKLLTKLIACHQVDFQRSWLSALERGEAKLFDALLIAASRNLKRLFVDSVTFNNTYYGTVLTTAVDSPAQHFLSRLEHVEYYSENALSFRSRAREVCPLLCLPSIKSISVDLPRTSLMWPQQKIPVSTLTSLHLRQTGFFEENMETILLATPHLKSLVYHATFHVVMDFLDCRRLSHCLSLVQGSLESLKISVEQYCFRPDFAYNEFRGTLGRLSSLQNFEKLQTLEIPFFVLLGYPEDKERKLVKVLPPHLRELRLRDDLLGLGKIRWGGEDFSGLVEKFLADRNEWDRDLKCLSLLLSHSQWREDTRNRLQEMCWQGDVECNITMGSSLATGNYVLLDPIQNFSGRRRRFAIPRMVCRSIIGCVRAIKSRLKST